MFLKDENVLHHQIKVHQSSYAQTALGHLKANVLFEGIALPAMLNSQGRFGHCQSVLDFIGWRGNTQSVAT